MFRHVVLQREGSYATTYLSYITRWGTPFRHVATTLGKSVNRIGHV